MENSDNPFSLAGQLLIANPGMQDPHFKQTVTLICEHDKKGALGITINRPSTVSLAEVLTGIGISIDDPGKLESLAQCQVLHGGPVQSNRGLILHSADSVWESSIEVSDQLSLTSSKDILESIGIGTSPVDYLFVLGYAGWGPGQLEQELIENSWLHANATHQLIFETKHEHCWRATAKSLGIDIDNMSIHAGHA
ncbi:MAG: YqgE/AlgH family protein [Proteobacteria bacterium]|nr:YqgE/AlgH family protein [Pseudomonadota bacterium]